MTTYPSAVYHGETLTKAEVARQQRRSDARNRPAPPEVLVEKITNPMTCAHCGKTCQRTTSTKKYCSPTCAAEATKASAA